MPELTIHLGDFIQSSFPVSGHRYSVRIEKNACINIHQNVPAASRPPCGSVSANIFQRLRDPPPGRIRPFAPHPVLFLEMTMPRELPCTAGTRCNISGIRYDYTVLFLTALSILFFLSKRPACFRSVKFFLKKKNK